MSGFERELFHLMYESRKTFFENNWSPQLYALLQLCNLFQYRVQLKRSTDIRFGGGNLMVMVLCLEIGQQQMSEHNSQAGAPYERLAWPNG